MREPENIKEVANLYPDFLGLIFYPKSKRYVLDSEASLIINAIPDNICKVGVFVNEEISKVLEKIKMFNLDAVQLHGIESPAYCEELKIHGIEIIKAFGIDNDFNFRFTKDYVSSCSYFLFDTKSVNYGGTGVKFNWNKLYEYNNEKPVFLSGGLEANDAGIVKDIKDFNLYAVDLNSKFEIKPALKNIELLKGFITELRK